MMITITKIIKIEVKHLTEKVQVLFNIIKEYLEIKHRNIIQKTNSFLNKEKANSNILSNTQKKSGDEMKDYKKPIPSTTLQLRASIDNQM